MEAVRRGFQAAVVALFVALSPLAAQERDARVLRPGEIGLIVRGEYLHFARRFGADGTEPLGIELGGALTPLTFPALEPLATGVAAFFTATSSDPFPLFPEDLLAGDVGVHFGWNRRNVPITLGLGLLPRVELTARMAVHRDERFPRRLTLTGGSIGVNPNPAGNAALLGGIDQTLTELGSSAVLPLEASRVGAEIQRRVEAATGSRLDLPTEALRGGDLLAEFAVDPFPHTLGLWQPGDLEIGARLLVLSSFGDRSAPSPGTGTATRLAAHGFARFPTGRQGDDHPIYDWGPPIGHAGAGVGAIGDLFFGDRFWITAGGEGRVTREADARFAIPPIPPLAPEAGIAAGRRKPGSEVEIWLTPRLRLSDEIGVGATFRTEYVSDGTERFAGVEREIAGGSRHSVGFSVRYSNLRTADAGESRLPIEMRVGFSGAVFGAEGLPASRTAYAQIDILRRLWGRSEAPR